MLATGATEAEVHLVEYTLLCLPLYTQLYSRDIEPLSSKIVEDFMRVPFIDSINPCLLRIFEVKKPELSSVWFASDLSNWFAVSVIVNGSVGLGEG